MFKDEVRKFGQELGIHRDLVMRHPFPGYVFLRPTPTLYPLVFTYKIGPATIPSMSCYLIRPLYSVVVGVF